jgi:L-alanine-DL-glutamate epimerase-like enolase superfamily enzyme
MSTTIRSVTCLPLRLPFDHGGPAPKFAGRVRTTLDSCLVRVELDGGLVGWGEAYSAELDAMKAVFAGRIAPLAVGQDATDRALTSSLERVLHNMGRSGLVVHALSGLDIALWDLRGKLEGVPLHELLGGARRRVVPAYASLLQYYGDTALIRRNVERSLEAGYGQVKLHERTTESVAAARAAMGPDRVLMVDTNCAWTADVATDAVRAMAPFDPFWIEEPLWPPEDIDALRALRAATGIPTAVGENASSLHELQRLVADRAVDYLQPSAIKAGGVTALWQLSMRCADGPVQLAPQSAFFGPGFLATLHVLAAQAREAVVERLYCDLSFTPYAHSIPFENGAFRLTDLPGLGASPADEAALAAFAQSTT